MVGTGSLAMPSMHLNVQAQIDNTLSAMGPSLYINRDSGTIVNGTETLKIVPIQKQDFQGLNDYNELWSLLSGDSGNYYFAILYMQNSDHSHVILAHEIRLNDYKALSTQTYEAKWVGRAFSSHIKVNIPSSNSIVKVNGFPVQTDSNGIASINVPGGTITVEAPTEITSSTGTRLRFESWENLGTANPLTFTIGSNGNLKANYETEYQLTVSTNFGNASGAGWYTQGTNATFSVPSMLTSSNGTRQVFTQFTGDYNSNSNKGWVVMNSSKRVSASWKTQFKVSIQLSGVPGSSFTTLNIDGKPLSVSGSNPDDLWVDAGTQLTINAKISQVQVANVTYNFSEILIDNQVADPNIVVNKPTLVTVVFIAQQKAPSKIVLETTPSSGVTDFLLGYFLGSLVLGFAFVFPISALALSAKAARSRRSQALLGLFHSPPYE
jgi:hypothetical protein